MSTTQQSSKTTKQTNPKPKGNGKGKKKGGFKQFAKKAARKGASVARAANTVLDTAGKVVSVVPVIGGVANKALDAVGDVMMLPENVSKAWSNNPAWYTKGVTAISGLNFNQRLGDANSSNAIQPMSIAYTIGLMVPSVEDYTQTAGVYTMEAFKTAVDIIFRRLRSANSGRANYEASDLAQYILNFRAYHAYLVSIKTRILAVNNIHINERSTPTNVCRALGLTDEDIEYISVNRANLLDAINYEISVFNKAMRMLPNMSLFERDKWLFSHLFNDSPNIKAVPSGFRPSGYFAISDDDSVTLEYNELDPSMAEAIGSLRALRNRITDNTLTNVIQGDIEKIFTSNPYLLEPVTLDTNVTEVYDGYLNAQIRNSTIFADNSSEVSGTYNDDAYRAYFYNFAVEGAQNQLEVIMTSEENDPELGKQLSMIQFTTPGRLSDSGDILATGFFSTMVTGSRAYYIPYGEYTLQQLRRRVSYISSSNTEALYLEAIIVSQVANASLTRVWNSDISQWTIIGDTDVTASYYTEQQVTFVPIVTMSLLDFQSTTPKDQ